MTSIDEAIAKYKEITNTDAICPANCNISCDKCVQESEQLLEWLEELKVIKDGSIPIIHGKEELELHDNAIRNKAIDDFTTKICEILEEYQTGFNMVSMANIWHFSRELAEQLKAGGKNERM